MLIEDLQWVEEQPEAESLKDLVREYAKNEYPVFNGNLRCSNLLYIDDQFRLTHWLRLWEYLSVYLIGIKELSKDAKILDCGGTGSYFSFWLAEQGYNVKVIDIQKFHSKLSSLVAEMRKLNNLRFCIEDMTEIAESDNSIDCIYSISVMEHLPKEERKKALSEMCRVLKPGGVICLTLDFGNDSNLSAKKGASQFCFTGIDEINDLIADLPMEFLENELTEEMNLYRRKRPKKEEFEIKYRLLTERLSSNSSLYEMFRYMFIYLTSKISPKLSYFFLNGYTTGDYNFFRVFLRKK